MASTLRGDGNIKQPQNSHREQRPCQKTTLKFEEHASGPYSIATINYES